MNFREIIIDELNEAKHNSLLLLDIDDTLVSAKGIYIYRKLPTDEKEIKLTPEQYANEKIIPNTKQYYNYRDFRDPKKVLRSIIIGNPIIPNLKTMDNYIKNGWTIGILTARGMEDIVYDAINKFLKHKNSKGDLIDIGSLLKRKLTFAVNDDIKKYKGATDYEKKKNVMLKLLDKYDRIWLLDDDQKNIDAINKLKEELRNKKDPRFAKLRGLKAIKGNKNEY